MDYAPGSRMILDATLLTLAKIASIQNRCVAILPGMRIKQCPGVKISHPVSRYELSLSGNINYAVIEYDEVRDNRIRLLAPDGSRTETFKIAKGCMFLVEAKHERSLFSYIPEAVSQGIALLALLKSTSPPEVRFCLSDGQSWIFFLLKMENGTLTYYESAVYHLSRNGVNYSDLPLRKIVLLICEWLSPTVTDLYRLDDSL